MSSVKRAMRQFTFGSGKTAGRNSSGRITSYHRGGGAKRLHRRIDLKRNAAPSSSMGVVERIEYDPNRSSRIALIRWLSGVTLPRTRRMPETPTLPPPHNSLSAEGSSVRGVFAFNSMMPPQHAGAVHRDVLISAFSRKGRSESEGEGVSLGLPRVAVAAARAAFFAPRVRGEERLQVRNWKRNSDVWEHRNKRKAAISWHTIKH